MHEVIIAVPVVVVLVVILAAIVITVLILLSRSKGVPSTLRARRGAATEWSSARSDADGALRRFRTDPSEQNLHALKAANDRLSESATALAEPVGAGEQSLPPDPIEQIRRLAELRDSGAITLEEFETKKIALLERLS